MSCTRPNLSIVPPPATSPASPCFETDAWLLYKVLYRASEFKNQDEAAAYLKRSVRHVQRAWGRKSPIQGRDLMALKARAESRGFVVAQQPTRKAA